MKIIIPMTGYGSRFVAAGYKELKPFIKVQGKPIIEWIIKGMYPNETNFLFVCRKEHIDNIPDMEQTLLTLAPEGQIYAIGDWVKKGPVYDILRASELIEDDEQCIVNYCDFYQEWDYEEFCLKVAERDCDGAISCYSGFHPNLIPKKNVYASCRIDEDENLLEIREKYSFEEDKTRARHSSGLYYFRTGNLLKYYFGKQIEFGKELNGEHYASLPYQFMADDGCKIWVPVNIKHFCQWGTPEDMKEYLFWTELTRRI